MRFEKLLLAFFALLGGLLVAGGAFYFYQSARAIPTTQIKTVLLISPTPTTSPVLLTIDSPQDTLVTDNKTVIVTGHTDPKATLVISTNTIDQVISPSSTGAFSTTVTISNDENYIHIVAIGPHGEEVAKTLTVTYSTENF